MPDPEITPTPTPEPTPSPAPKEPAAPAPAPAAEPNTDGKKEGDDDKTLLGDDGKTKDVKPAIPEKYEFKLPEGMAVNQEALDAITPAFKEAGLTQENAQKLIEAYHPVMQKMMDAQRESAMGEFKTMVDGWKQDTIKMYGADYAKELANASRFIDALPDSDKVREVLNETGVGNHPVLVKAFVEAGKIISEDSFTDTNKRRPGGDPLNKLYPSMAK